ncbi:ORF3 [Anelloviridae sp.]|nr:ORF3 [Anelloviridae sp.]
MYSFSTAVSGTLEDTHQTGQLDTMITLPFQNTTQTRDLPLPINSLTRYKSETRKRWAKGCCTRGITKKESSKKKYWKPGTNIMQMLQLLLQGRNQQEACQGPPKEGAKSQIIPQHQTRRRTATRRTRRLHFQKNTWKKYTTSSENSSEGGSTTETCSSSDTEL